MADKTQDIHTDRGGVAVRKNNGCITINNQWLIQSDLNEETIKERETQYLGRVIADCGRLAWLTLMNLEEGDSSMGLDAVYTALLTERRHDRELTESGKIEPTAEDPVRQGRLSAVELLNREQRLVLLGDPGSAKSAFVNFVALCLAGEQLKYTVNLQVLTQPLPDTQGRPQTCELKVEGKDESIDEEVRQNWDHGVLIPLRIILRDFSAATCFPQDADTANAAQLLKFLRLDLKRKGCEDYFEVLKERLRSGQVLVMLDGLDEVAQAGDRRKHLVACIDDFVKTFGTCRFLVTCRPYAYRNRAWQLPHFAFSELAAFERGQIIRFIQRWYARLPALDKQATTERGHDLQQAVLSRPDLRDLTKRPLLLSLIAYLHAYHHELPARRADLYQRLLGLLVDKWEKARFNVVDDDVNRARQLAQASLAEFLQIGQDAIRKVLERLAFRAHAGQDGQQDTADITAKDLNHELLCEAKRKNQDNVNVWGLSEYLRDRVGILYQRGGSNETDAIYTFPHRSSGSVWNLLKALAARKDESELTRHDAWGLLLASEILSESVALHSMNQRQERIFNEIQASMPEVLMTQHLVGKEQVDAGRYLGRIGDPRTALTDVDAMPLCHVPAGSFFMGQGEHDSKNEVWSLKEIPAGEYDLNYDYWIAQYPVTVAQFQAFVDQRGFGIGDLDVDVDALKAGKNTPVVWISQHEALAFCDWLTQHWREAGLLPEGWRVTLPNEPEWEKAARGGLNIPAKPSVVDMAVLSSKNFSTHCAMQPNSESQRRYPWGNEIDDDCANYDYKIGRISTPGVYPQGISPYGCYDLAGNVWEWTRSKKSDYPYPAIGTAEWKQLAGENSAVCVRVARRCVQQSPPRRAVCCSQPRLARLP